MRFTFVFVIFHFTIAAVGQDLVEGPWSLEGGASSNNRFRESYSFNLRYISPKFQMSNRDHYWTEEEGKHPEKFKRARFMFEMLYTPPFEILGMGCNLQYRFLRCGRVSLEAYAGLKFFFATRSDFGSGTNTGIWYINNGLICQLDLGMIAPFVDIGYDRILTVGSEFKLYRIYKKVKRRYNLNLQPA